MAHKPIKELAQRLDEQKRISEGYLERLMRLQAEFENYRKRMEKERQEHIRFASEGIVRSLVDVSENLERAIETGQKARESGNLDPLLRGVEMTLGQLNEILRREGLSPIEAVGRPFDPNYHEAISKVTSKDHAANVVVKEYVRGYLLNSKVLRPAKVEVSSGEAPEKREEV